MADESQKSCPIVDYRHNAGPSPAGTHFIQMDRLRAEHRPFFRTNDGPEGYWVFTEYDAILEGLQHAELFSSSVMVPVDPNPTVKWIPVMLDPPQHAPWRQLLSGHFSPNRVRSLEDKHRQFAIDIIRKFSDQGRCDFYSDFAAVYPTTIFLQIMGLPLDELDRFMRWEELMLHATEISDPDRSKAAQATAEVIDYFRDFINEKRKNSQTRGDDIISGALDWRINGEPPSDADLLSCMLLLFMAGLDTVAAQLTYTFYHLAHHPEDRQKLLANPARIPIAVEEFVRAYPIVQTSRIATQDIDFHGCPVKKGEVVHFPLAMANRDPFAHPRGGTVDLDVSQPPRHIGFGAGPHRCLGSHLARQELTLVLEEWHRLIPNYELADESIAVERTGGVFSIAHLPLRWTI